MRDLPSHAHVPGRNPRHPEGTFDDLHRSVRPGMSMADLAQTAAWQSGVRFLRAGYFWEAHEAMEPVWMATPPGSAQRHFVQGVIQVANAALKQVMGRPRAVTRLCDIAEHHLAISGPGWPGRMGLGEAELQDRLSDLRQSGGLASGNKQDNA